MYAALMELLPSGGIVAVKFASRERADEWADKHSAEVVGFAPTMSLSEAASLQARNQQITKGGGV